MALTTSQQITRYYQEFEHTEVTFTQEIIKALFLNTKQIFIKCLGYQWPCIVYSSSMTGARVITTLQPSLKAALSKSKNMVSLRFSFIQREKTDPLAFFVTARITGFSPYGDPSKGLSFITLHYTQRPPDDLIERLGNLLSATISSQRRREERIIISPDVQKKLGLSSKGAYIEVDKVPRKGLIRDISFGGAKVIMQGVPQFLVNRPALIRLDFEEPEEQVVIPAKIVRFEPVEGRSDLAAYAIQYEETKIPMTYKLRLNDYLRFVKSPSPKASPAPAAGTPHDSGASTQ
ncbi:PilZ domain-containing protein [Alkalispirochaeta americana]|uniref:PilZ domain-containing protein n=2 Tax=Alkalispirochaeta americana TaxID=159291 RepID=A0A1N6WF93_9SPIO|nr:PilZ domain-containing protein [Alkalispirochaeta americana]